MMLQRIGKSIRGKLYFTFVVIHLSLTIIYIIHIQEQFKVIKWSENRCMSELSSVKAQLQAVTEYKNKLDQFLTDSHKKHDTQRQQYKEVLDSCGAMKQQAVICQNQFEDLQSECKKVKEKLHSQVEKNPEKSKVK